MGLAAARIVGKEHYGCPAWKVVLVGRTVKKLENAVTELQSSGIEAEAVSGDVGDRTSMERLAASTKDAAQKTGGNIAAVIHAAGMSPHMGDGKEGALKIMNANALGTINVNVVFSDVMKNGGCIVDVSSMSGYFLPHAIIPQRAYRLAWTNSEKAVNKMMHLVNIMPRRLKTSVAYALSKNFISWFAVHDAARMGVKGLRVVSVSPGFFETAMGELEKSEAVNYMKYVAVRGGDDKPRLGKPEEVAALLAFVASPCCGYLTGVDILCDGGVCAGKHVI
jgi:NAD(P)-dependent dehydrogenase (short-subunit alcohol dehydrogenase family)